MKFGAMFTIDTGKWRDYSMKRVFLIIAFSFIIVGCSNGRNASNETGTSTSTKAVTTSVEEVQATEVQRMTGISVPETTGGSETNESDAELTIESQSVNDKDRNARKMSNYDVEFSIYRDRLFIPIKAWNSDFDITEVTGQPLKNEIVILGSGSDTFAGSYLMTNIYEEMVMELFSPKGNGKTFWINRIFVDGKTYTTYRGISVGDTLDKLRQAYPELIHYEDNDYCYYSPDEEGLLIRFNIEDDVILNYEIVYEMP